MKNIENVASKACAPGYLIKINGEQNVRTWVGSTDTRTTVTEKAECGGGGGGGRAAGAPMLTWRGSGFPTRLSTGLCPMEGTPAVLFLEVRVAVWLSKRLIRWCLGSGAGDTRDKVPVGCCCVCYSVGCLYRISSGGLLGCCTRMTWEGGP